MTTNTLAHDATIAATLTLLDATLGLIAPPAEDEVRYVDEVRPECFHETIYSEDHDGGTFDVCEDCGEWWLVPPLGY